MIETISQHFRLWKCTLWLRRVGKNRLSQIEIGDLLLPGIEVIGRPGIDEIIVGRDVLNQLIVTLNGLAHVAEVRD